jgi:hypothetical protein
MACFEKIKKISIKRLMSAVNDISNEYRSKFLRNQLKFNRKYKGIFDDIGQQFAQFVNDPNIKFAKAFVFPPYIKKQMTMIMTDFHNRTLSMTQDDIRDGWDLANQKNDRIVRDYLKTISIIKESQAAAYFLPNLPALKAFISREKNSETLSDAVWKVSKQFRGELETHLGIGISQGDSAQVISQRIRQYLQNPDALFRRVRDNQGRLVASKKMLEYHPGQGVYRSAYKNALRVARTNTNQAYLLADHIKWLQLDMVKGVRISLSAQHPKEDICDELQGDYPKDFIWVGWHPQDLCHATPIMSSQKDFLEYLRGNKPLDTEQITEYPESFINYTKQNFERFSNYKSLPFWLEDNIDIINKLIK